MIGNHILTWNSRGGEGERSSGEVAKKFPSVRGCVIIGVETVLFNLNKCVEIYLNQIEGTAKASNLEVVYCNLST